MAEEKRKHERFKSVEILEYDNGFWVPVTDTVTKDISGGGICFYSDKKLKTGLVLRVKLYHDTKMPPEIFIGKVVWSKPSEDEENDGYLNGLKFKDVK